MWSSPSVVASLSRPSLKHVVSSVVLLYF
jgi:hypothetical protein